MGIAATPAAAPQRIPGHEITGVVTEVGADVAEVTVGDRVGASMMFACGSCEPCRLGAEECCERGDLAGITTNGGYAEYMRLPARSAIPLPDGLAFDTAPGENRGNRPYPPSPNHANYATDRTDASGEVMVPGLSLPLGRRRGLRWWQSTNHRVAPNRQT